MSQTKPPKIDLTVTGNYFEDFKLGQEIVHATPRTVTVGDVSLFTALYGPRFAVQSSDAFAHAIGYPRSPARSITSATSRAGTSPTRSSRSSTPASTAGS